MDHSQKLSHLQFFLGKHLLQVKNFINKESISLKINGHMIILLNQKPFLHQFSHGSHLPQDKLWLNNKLMKIGFMKWVLTQKLSHLQCFLGSH